MSALLDLIRRAQELGLPAGSKAGNVIEDALDALLLAEGPETQPIENFSEGLTTAIARSPSGRIRYLVHTWTTGPWRCLLFDLAPVPMGRPQLLTDATTGARRVTVDWPSRKMQHQLRFACNVLKLPPIPEPSRLFTAFDRHRTFAAWTAYSDATSVLKGDLDNYAKNVLDGLQRATLIRNDKTVASLVAVNVPMPAAVHSLDDHLRHLISGHLTQFPGHTPRRIAQALNLPVQRTERLYRELHDEIQDLRLTLVRKHLASHPLDKPSAIAKACGLATSVVAKLLPFLDRSTPPEDPAQIPTPAASSPAPMPASVDHPDLLAATAVSAP